MVFDFETTGLPRRAWTDYTLKPTINKRNGQMIPASVESDYPYAVQLSYILYNIEKKTARIVDDIVRLPENVMISPESEAIHHISLEKTQGKTRKVMNREIGIYYFQKKFNN